jgi:hypothetical protein
MKCSRDPASEAPALARADGPHADGHLLRGRARGAARGADGRFALTPGGVSYWLRFLPYSTSAWGCPWLYGPSDAGCHRLVFDCTK